MPIHFPPGGTNCRPQRTHSPWREFAFMHHQIRRWIAPHLDLPRVLKQWSEIRYGLAEPTRQRILQISRAFPQKPNNKLALMEGGLGGVQPSHRPKAGKHGRFSLLQPSHSRPGASPTVPERGRGGRPIVGDMRMTDPGQEHGKEGGNTPRGTFIRQPVSACIKWGNFSKKSVRKASGKRQGNVRQNFRLGRAHAEANPDRLDWECVGYGIVGHGRAPPVKTRVVNV